MEEVLGNSFATVAHRRLVGLKNVNLGLSVKLTVFSSILVPEELSGGSDQRTVSGHLNFKCPKKAHKEKERLQKQQTGLCEWEDL